MEDGYPGPWWELLSIEDNEKQRIADMSRENDILYVATGIMAFVLIIILTVIGLNVLS
ncbi:MAG: hypothetical protein KBB78_00925 [Candidatus Pacebacteria bacterium]|nr:hypothetical protein [Candidatus Paceibacterota bacterium]